MVSPATVPESGWNRRSRTSSARVGVSGLLSSPGLPPASRRINRVSCRTCAHRLAACTGVSSWPIKRVSWGAAYDGVERSQCSVFAECVGTPGNSAAGGMCRCSVRAARHRCAHRNGTSNVCSGGRARPAGCGHAPSTATRKGRGDCTVHDGMAGFECARDRSREAGPTSHRDIADAGALHPEGASGPSDDCTSECASHRGDDWRDSRRHASAKQELD